METTTFFSTTGISGQKERLPGVEYDANGMPAGYTVEEVFDKLDKGLIEFYGEDVRKMVNERRTQWNNESFWKFDLL
jgi:hypothetical protein